MTSAEVRETFLSFFNSRGHEIVKSAPIVIKNDPTLMFTNAGMNQFKDFFLGHKAPTSVRIADTQKCLRVSGKHNDLEEVGVDTYHHTMFEMLGNWSFGDYFKAEAIQWAWELLTEVYKLDVDRLYVTVFGGDEKDGLVVDTESEQLWLRYVNADRILRCSKKDNFWEMGDTGPCGSCSEIHMDLRSEEERKALDGKSLVNADHPQVIELWNLVFMEFNRKADGSLEPLPAKHVDTGMGLERVVRAIQMKNSNYDTDLFQITISELEKLSGRKYGELEQTDIAFRVVADHLRALAFCIADGQLPSNTGSGYVIRRILRRAVRYGYSFLGLQEPFLNKLIPGLANRFQLVFPELHNQKDFVQNIVRTEETSFIQTLFSGLDRLNKLFADQKIGEIDGLTAFELYDTFGFPPDLTRLIASEKGVTMDEVGFNEQLRLQKERSRADASKTTGDWHVLAEDLRQEFIGYDKLEAKVEITRYRTMTAKGHNKFQLVFNFTPFYGESGGQVGDTGTLTGEENGEVIQVTDTQKENDLIVHLVDRLPVNFNQSFVASVDATRRDRITKNHSATHLMHSALRQVLGNHVAQKGSLVDDEKLRFDFSHFEKPSADQVTEIENIVNQKIKDGVALWEDRAMPYADAIAKGVTALFGEKYGDLVRVVVFDEQFSMELCGGTHVANTSSIGGFKILAESSVAAGVRRVEAITSEKLEAYFREKVELLDAIAAKLDHPADLLRQLDQIMAERADLSKKMEQYEQIRIESLQQELKGKMTSANGVHHLVERINDLSPASAKDLAFRMKQITTSIYLVLVHQHEGKPGITVMLSDDIVSNKQLNAGNLVREWGKLIKGGGGGQPFFAQAGGSDVSGMEAVVQEALKITI